MAAVISAALILLTVFGMSFIFGSIQGSTTLLLPYDQIDAYNTLTEKTDQILAPYATLLAAVTVLDFLAIGVILASAATFRRSIHKVVVFVAPFITTADILLEGYYRSLTQQALTQLSSIMDTNTLNVALQVQEKFNAAYGFWGSPEYYSSVSVLSWATVVLLIVAAFTMKSITLSEPVVGETKSIPEVVPSEKPPTPKERSRIPPGLKFCRYCGAKILRESMFCEECGSKLVG